jgi:hypothetical protein
MTMSDTNPYQFFFVSRDLLSPTFRQRVAGRRTDGGVCGSCGGPIETGDQIALILFRDITAAMICCGCTKLTRAELIEKVFRIVRSKPCRRGPETPELLVARAKMGECAIALYCGLDPDAAVDWSIDGDWDYGLFAGARTDP